MDTFTDEHDEFGFIGDVFKAIGSAVEDVAGAIGDVVKVIPGGSWILDGIGTVTGVVGDFVEGPMRDFAKTGVGETIFRAASVAMSQALYVVPAVGYTLGFLAWSVPGLAKGEQVDAALTKEFIYRTQEVAKVFVGKAAETGGKALTDAAAKLAGKAASDMMANQLKSGVEKLNQLAQNANIDIGLIAKQLNLTPASLASMLGIRQDVAAYAIAWAEGKGESALKSINTLYNPLTGEPKPIRSLGKRTPTTPIKITSPIVVNKVSALSSAPKLLASAAPIRSLGKRTVPATTIAAQTVVHQAESVAASDVAGTPNEKILNIAQATKDTRSTKLGIAAGLAAATVGVGGSLLAGLSAAVAAPVGIGFGLGSGIVTKLLLKSKS